MSGATSAPAQSPPASAAISRIVAGAGLAVPTDPAPRQTGHSSPPDATWKAACGPGVPHRAHSVSAGAQPARAMARNRKASSTSEGSLAVSDSARSADTTSRYSRSEGSRSSDVSRSAVSTIAVAQVYRG